MTALILHKTSHDRWFNRVNRKLVAASEWIQWREQSVCEVSDLHSVYSLHSHIPYSERGIWSHTASLRSELSFNNTHTHIKPANWSISVCFTRLCLKQGQTSQKERDRWRKVIGHFSKSHRINCSKILSHVSYSHICTVQSWISKR